jgi:hypothetical protein
MIVAFDTGYFASLAADAGSYIDILADFLFTAGA